MSTEAQRGGPYTPPYGGWLERRLPSQFAGKPILFRIPFTMRGEVLVPNATIGVPFPDAVFLHTVDKPFEIHRMKATIMPFNNATPSVVVSPATLVVQAQDLRTILADYVRLEIVDQSKNEKLTRNPTLVESLVDNEARTWEWEDPYTIVRAEGFQVTADNLAPAAFALVGGAAETVANLSIRLSFQGYLLVIAPPSETR